MALKPCLDCGTLTTSSRCRPCHLGRERVRDQVRGRRQARGLDAEYDRNRETLLASATVCAICGRPGTERDPLTAGHITARADGGTLRSSPTPEGRCCLQPTTPTGPRPGQLRSSPTPEGRCCIETVTEVHAPFEVAILTDPGGPVLPAGDRLSGLVHDVAILTDPGGPVLPRCTPGGVQGYRGCDPHRPRRAGAADLGHKPTDRKEEVAILTDPGGPVLRERDGPTGQGAAVAILTDPGGPVLHSRMDHKSRRNSSCDPHRPRRAGAAPRCGTPAHLPRVAILTDPGGPVLRRNCAGCTRPSTGCDPHRPRRAGAARHTWPVRLRQIQLRSSPTPEGRCCVQRVRADAGGGGVAILTDPGGPVLPAMTKMGSGVREVAILTDPGGPVLPWIFGLMLDLLALRSSPTPEGRCCAALAVARQINYQVAILTDPGGPVLHLCRGRYALD